MKVKYLLFLFVSLQFINCSKSDNASDDTPKLSAENRITSFKLTPHDISYAGSIDHASKTISVETIGLEQNVALVPNIAISPNASIFPDPSIAQNFNEVVDYLVIAANGERATYSINTNNTAFSNEKKILSFQFNIDGVIFDGIINHNTLTIEIDSYKDITHVSPIISVSENANVTPNSSEFQNFTNDIEYIVTAENGSTNTYKVNTRWFSIGTLNSAYNTSDIATKYYSNAKPYVRTTFADLTIPNSKITLENNLNSYELNYYNYDSYIYEDILYTSFQIEFPNNIVTATDYKLRYEVNNIVKAEANFNVDVLVENAPQITSSNQTVYQRNDILILYGINLVPGLRIPADGSVYVYNQNYVSINNDNTELTFPMTINGQMFPSYHGQSEDQPTPIIIYFNGRYGDSIIVDFD